LRRIQPDAIPDRYRTLAGPIDDPDLIRAHVAGLPAKPISDLAPGTDRLALHSQTPTTTDRWLPAWRHEVYDVPGRFAHLSAVERCAADIRTLLQPRDPSAQYRHKGER
jgi:hypothetical protein